ncbi:unnamed protein product, partial [Notodromas monacha]
MASCTFHQQAQHKSKYQYVDNQLVLTCDSSVGNWTPSSTMMNLVVIGVNLTCSVPLPSTPYCLAADLPPLPDGYVFVGNPGVLVHPILANLTYYKKGEAIKYYVCAGNGTWTEEVVLEETNMTRGFLILFLLLVTSCHGDLPSGKTAEVLLKSDMQMLAPERSESIIRSNNNNNARSPAVAFNPSLPQQQQLLEIFNGQHLNMGHALYLTKFLEDGKFQEAREASLVKINATLFPDLELLNNAGVPTHSGYITVNKSCDSNLFFWYTAAKENSETAPLILWLPGGSGLFSLFLEHGPWFVDSQLKVYARYHDWSRTHGVLYVDNPVGIGNYTARDECYATSQEDVARDLYSFLQQFLIYKGLVALSYLKGIGIGNGFCDPINMIHWGDFLFTIGMAGYEERDRFRELAQAARQQIKKEKWTLAARLIDTILGGVMTPGHTSMFTNVTAYNYYFNFRLPVEPKEFTYYFQFLDLIPVREAIHVGKTVYHNSRKVQTKIFPDMGRSVKNKIENLLNKGLK